MSTDVGRPIESPGRSLTRASVLAVLVNVVGSGLRLGLQVTLARTLGVAGYGQFTLGRSWGELLARIPNSGYEAGAVKELPRAEHAREDATFRGFVRAAWRTTATRAAFIAVVGVAIYSLAVDAVDDAIVLGLVLTVPLALVQLARGLLQGHHRFVAGSALVEVVQPVAFAASVAVLWAVDRLDVTTALGSWIVTMGLAAAIGALRLQRGRSPGVRTAAPATPPDRWRSIRRPLYASQLALVVLDNADILLVGALMDRRDVALYAVATRLAVLGRILLGGVQSVAASHLARAAAADDVAESQRVVDRSLRLCAWPGLAITLVTAVLAGPLVDVFGRGYGDAVDVLRVLLIGNLVNSLTGPSGYVVSLGGLERIYAVTMWCAAIATMVLVPCGVAAFGAVGAAWAVSLVTVAWNVALLVLARRRLGVRCWVRPQTFRGAA